MISKSSNFTPPPLSLLSPDYSSPVQHTSLNYRPDIDGLRAIAVLAVVIFHYFPNILRGGFIGVDIFFVISGFLISSIIFSNLEKNTFSFAEFYIRRIRRIFPVLILVLVVCFSFGWFVLFADELNQLGKHIAAGSGFVSNLVLWSEVGYFDNAAETKPLLHLWSLGIEEQFYIIWPLLLWLAWRFRISYFIIIAIVGTTSFILNIRGTGEDAVATFYSPQTRFWELLCGSLLAWLTLYKKELFTNLKNKMEGYFSKNGQEKANPVLANMLSVLGLLLLVYGFLRINKRLSFPGVWALVPVIGAMLIIAAGSETWINRKILSNKIAVWFGLISYPLYLWHWPIFSFGTIIYSGKPDRWFRLSAVCLSILLSWLTVKFIEKPIRFGNQKVGLKVASLCILVFSLGVGGYVVHKADFTLSHIDEKLLVKRKGFEHAKGSSLAWYRGKDDWLFLGNAYNDAVAKLKLAKLPTEKEVESVRKVFSKIAEKALQYNTIVALIIGPNKSSVYPEYLPDEFIPSPKKYISFFEEKLKNIPNLTVYNPTDDLRRIRKKEGLLYWMTDTHWNNKGAFLAYSGLLKQFNLPIPEAAFREGAIHKGDLIGISKLKDFPLHVEDNWDVVWKNKPVWIERKFQDKEVQNVEKDTFGEASVIINQNPLSDKYIWVVGDSFASALKQYFNATFKEVRYVGHWRKKLEHLHLDLEKAERKPDMIFIVRVERSF